MRLVHTFAYGVVHKWRHAILDSPIITLLSTKAFVLLSQNHWPPPLTSGRDFIYERPPLKA